MTVAAAWDRKLAHARGQDMADEFVGKGAHVALGPVAGPLGRSGYGGRNWEGFSPDPWLTGELFAETIVGMEERGIQACAKREYCPTGRTPEAKQEKITLGTSKRRSATPLSTTMARPSRLSRPISMTERCTKRMPGRSLMPSKPELHRLCAPIIASMVRTVVRTASYSTAS